MTPEIRDATFYVIKAEAEIGDRNYNQAIEYCEKALEIYPDYPQAYLCRALSLLNTLSKSSIDEQERMADVIRGDIEKSLELVTPLKSWIKGLR